MNSSEENTHRTGDIFDRLFALPLLERFNPMFQKYREIFLYLLFGGIAFLLNIVLFAMLCAAGLHELFANCICWLACALFQYYTNCNWVFKHRAKDFFENMKQIMKFLAGRVLSLGAEEIIIFVFIVLLNYSALAVKIAAQIVVIALNYIVSKWFVFN